MFKTRFFRPVAEAILQVESAEDFAQFYDTVHVDVFRYIYALVGRNQHEAEDLTAETFIRAWKSRQRFRGSAAAAKGWILVIAKHVVIDQHRRERHRQETIIPAKAWEQAASPSSSAATDLADELAHLLHLLPVEQREILVLRYLLDWPVSAIAAHLGKRENTVSVTIRRCLQRLRIAYEQHGKEDYV